MRGVSRTTLVAVLVVVVVIVAVAVYVTGKRGAPIETSPAPSTSPTTSPSTSTTSPVETSPSTTSAIEETTAVEEGEKVLVIAIGIDADNLDPVAQTTTLISNIVDFMVEPLFKIDEKGNLVPWLAESYEVSEDGKEIIVKLRKGVYFQDGTPLTAEAVRFTFMNRVLNESVRVPLRSWFAALDRVEVVDDYTVKFVLKYPYAPFLRVLTTTVAGIVSPNAVKKLGERIAYEPFDIGTGPFKFKEWVKGDRIVLVKNENYWRGPVKIDKVIFKIVPEAQTREAMLLAGDVDMVVLPPPTDIPKLEADPTIRVVKADSTRYLLVGILQKGPLKDKRVRQALNYAVDKEALVNNVLFGLASVAKSPMPPGFFGYFEMPVYKYDLDKARELLRQAGWQDVDGDGVLENSEGQEFTLKMLVPTGRYLFDRQVGEAIQSMLRKAGIRVELITPDWPTFVAMLFKPLNETEHDLVLVGWGPWVLDADFMLYPTLHSSQMPPKGFNFVFYNNSKLDELLDKARAEPDPKKRLDLYRQAVELIWDDPPWIFLYVQKYVIAYKDYVKGVKVYPIEKFDITEAYIER